MIYQEIQPCPALQPFVRNYLLVHFDHLPDNQRVKPYPTRIEQALVFFAKGRIRSHDPLTNTTTNIAPNALFGQHVSRLNFHTFTEPDFLMLMVIFQPGAMHRLLGFSSHELTQEFCDAEAVMNAGLQSVNDQIANSPTYPAMIERAENYLLRKLRTIRIDAHPIDRIGELLLHNPTPFSLDWLADQANLSPRQFERKFSERMGIGPKLYSRISRFYQTFDYKEKNLATDWLTVAIQFGYTDYDHLAKDFKQFTHVTPNLILREYAQRPEMVVNL
ncbi:helix-turn-helix domain-containing protein [Fibrella aquatilis]|uniref:AraC family transcriptional regulator n=1 Tax=Fibrella aquatilis TaxID=2817059 RepID=A0A939G001_9BACT|nr:helix-turn-helix domain-containing protein [Fibrella aquatilis]MBO0929356.1 AraC family transcriptional regulator [Fibrella aquatilis]